MLRDIVQVYILIYKSPHPPLQVQGITSFKDDRNKIQQNKEGCLYLSACLISIYSNIRFLNLPCTCLCTFCNVIVTKG